MSKQSSERRSYSVDEMMEKLRDGQREKREQEESELVTRPDGSQVVRVRRRRRRSNQPHKVKEVRRRRTGLFALIAGVCIVVALGATVLILLARFNSKGYRDHLKERVLASTGAKLSINELTVTPFRARAKGLAFTWPSDGIVKSLRLNGLSANLEASSFIGADWSGKEVVIDAGQLVLGPSGERSSPDSVEESFPFDYEGYRCSKLDIIYGEIEEEPAILLSASEVTMRPRKEGGMQFLINGGRALIPGWNELRIDRGLAEVEEDRMEIVSLRLNPTGVGAKEGGEATLRSVKPIRFSTPTELEVELTNFPLAQVLGGTATGLGRFLDGRIDTREKKPGRIDADPGILDSGAIEIPFTGIEGTIKDFLFLHGLDGILKSVDYATPSAGTISGVFRRDKNGMSLREFQFETKALLKLEGTVELSAQGGLGGSLRVGIPQGVILDKIARPYRPAFSAPELGYCWITVELSGTVDRPLDDFSRVLKEQSEDSGLGTEGPTTPKELLEDAFQRLTEEGSEEGESKEEEE